MHWGNKNTSYKWTFRPWIDNDVVQLVRYFCCNLQERWIHESYYCLSFFVENNYSTNKPFEGPYVYCMQSCLCLFRFTLKVCFLSMVTILREGNRFFRVSEKKKTQKVANNNTENLNKIIWTLCPTTQIQQLQSKLTGSSIHFRHTNTSDSCNLLVLMTKWIVPYNANRKLYNSNNYYNNAVGINCALPIFLQLGMF